MEGTNTSTVLPVTWSMGPPVIRRADIHHCHPPTSSINYHLSVPLPVGTIVLIAVVVVLNVGDGGAAGSMVPLNATPAG